MAELLLVASTQASFYGQEIKDLSAGKQVHKDSKLAGLNPFLSYEITVDTIIISDAFATPRTKPRSKLKVQKIVGHTPSKYA